MKNTKKQVHLTQQQYADHLGLSQQAVSKMIRAGRIPTVHGRIDRDAADAALAIDSETGGEMTLAEAMRRKEAALAALREHELQRRRGEVCVNRYVVEQLEKHITIVRSQLLSFPTRLIAGLSLDDQQRRRALDLATATARQALTDMAAILGADDGLSLCPKCEKRLQKLAASVEVPRSFLPKEVAQ